MRTDAMSKDEAQFWRLQRYAHPWPPPWLAHMHNQSNPVVFLDVAVHALDRFVSSKDACLAVSGQFFCVSEQFFCVLAVLLYLAMPTPPPLNSTIQRISTQFSRSICSVQSFI
jgi:hypothetical protein